MVSGIAIVGMACLYPDARSPVELWENVLSQRRAFRSIPAQRLRLEDYLSNDRRAPDSIYSSRVAVIEGYEFDRVAFSVAGDTFRAADMAHWLALDIAGRALKDGGFDNGIGLPRETTGVFLGNTLTGEFSRANSMRLRWPYVRRVVDASLAAEGWSLEQRSRFLKNVEVAYKEPFPNVGEESLAGGLSNTIAGRVCNYFDLKGGGYTIDGACASSLLAVANACSSLTATDVDVALAGGVDLSLDPFELVGFAKTGALASELMRVFDARSDGFWPGEGCGFVLLMRHEDALDQQRRIHAVIRGWGISSDGAGGITRPEVAGQLLALGRAYHRAGFGIETVPYFEGHGTGTKVGDTTELLALSTARRQASSEVCPGVIGSVKANIGHTKAAAGVAGLIKSAMAVSARILPPTTACEQPHSLLSGESAALRVLSEGQPWPAGEYVRAGVSSMGFGGINVHVVLEGVQPNSHYTLSSLERSLLSSAQDAELFLLGARTTSELQSQLENLLTFAARLSRAELSDVAGQLEKTLDHCEFRAAIVASCPSELAARLEILKSMIESGAKTKIDTHSGVALGAGMSRPRIGFLFPGQGSPSHLGGGVWPRRFEFLRELYAHARLPVGNEINTNVVQPAIVTSSLAALDVLTRLNITAEIAVGHSLGELTALGWAGAFDRDGLLRIATARGRTMMKTVGPVGAMASIRAETQAVEELLDGQPVVIAGINTTFQTVISGEATAVAMVVARARAKNLVANALPVSHAFHSPLMASVAPVLAEHLAHEVIKPPQRAVISTITGDRLSPGTDVRELLIRQITSPVLYMAAANKAISEGVDLWLEVGPGDVLRGLMAQLTTVPVVSVDAGGSSFKGLMFACGAAFVLGQPVHHGELFAGRFTRPFNLNWQPRFFANACEMAPVSEIASLPSNGTRQPNVNAVVATAKPANPDNASPLELVSRLVAQRAELPSSAVKSDSRLLSDLHLNSITVGQLVAQAATCLGLPRPVSATDYADVTVAEVAEALATQLLVGHGAQSAEDDLFPAGIDSWIRPFTIDLIEKPLLQRQATAPSGKWNVLAAPQHPLADLLRRAFEDLGAGSGTVVCLPRNSDERQISLLLEGAREVLGNKEGGKFVLVQHEGGAAAFARTLHQEAQRIDTCVVNVPEKLPQAVEWVIAEALAVKGFVEAHYDRDGRRYEPVAQLLPVESNVAEPILSAEDVVVVTGGGKGITAECALALAQNTGAHLVVLGLARPETDAELAQNLKRMTAAGIGFKYISADVTNARAVHAAIHDIESDFGPVTGIIHGAAKNVPHLLGELDEETFRSTVAVKVQGARSLLAAVNPDKLRLLINFGSIIARTGLPGEADYGVANEWLRHLTEQWQAAHPNCRCIAVEWSIWSGVGMGARLGGIDMLVRQGIIPIPPDKGCSMLRQLLSQSLPAVSVVVMGRFREMPTFKITQPELALLRFLERPRVYYPNVELVVDVDLSTDTDPYLNDHQIQGERLLPAVIGLEAMAQVATALVGATRLTSLQEVDFNRPVVVPEKGSLKIRIAALVTDAGFIEVALRSEETAFQVDHFRVICRVDDVALESVEASRPLFENGNRQRLASVSPENDLYGGILFHRGRFRRLSGYQILKATECLAEITPDGTTSWFSQYLADKLVLGDPGIRDAAIHAIQACIPHATLLPVGVDRVLLNPVRSSAQVFVHAQERAHHGDIFTYDLQVREADGYVRESWERLRLRTIGTVIHQSPWAISLLSAYAERRVQELIPGSKVSVALEEGGGVERRVQSNRAIQLALGEDLPVLRRPNGRPEINDKRAVSASHLGNLTLAVAGAGPLGCDIEQVTERSASVWRDLLGDHRAALAGIIRSHANEDEAMSATRVWAAGECLKKAGAGFDAPLLFITAEADSWVLLSSGHLKVATYVTQVRAHRGKLAIAVLVSNDAHL